MKEKQIAFDIFLSLTAPCRDPNHQQVSIHHQHSEKLFEFIPNLNQRVATLDHRVSSLDQRVSALDQRASSLDQGISSLLHMQKQQINMQNQQIDSNRQQLDTLREGLLEMKQTMQTSLQELQIYYQTLQQDIFKIQKKQDMIFTKQDQIQSTLYGDMPPLQNTTSSTALSPPFTSPTASHVGFRMSTHVEQPQQSDITSVLDSELDSILTFSSYNWEQTTQQPLHAGWPQHGTSQGDVSNLPQVDEPWKQENTTMQVQQETTQQQQGSSTVLQQERMHPGTLPGDVSEQQEGSSTTFRQQAGLFKQERIHSGTLQGDVSEQQGSSAAFKQQAGLFKQERTHPGTLQGDVSELPQHEGDTGQQQRLRNPADILSQTQLWPAKDAGKLARLLASQAFFGDDTLRMSTVRGDLKRGLRALDGGTMNA